MKLHNEFEVVRGALLNKNHVPSLDTCVGELLREEQHLLAQGIMSHDVVISEHVTNCRLPRVEVKVMHATCSVLL
jgi:hypothetical protein